MLDRLEKKLAQEKVISQSGIKALKIRYVLIKVYLVDIWRVQNSIETTKSGVI